MRYRVPALLVATFAVIALAAPAASAGSDLPPVSEAVSGTNYGPIQILTNDNSSLGITYPGTGHQATITSQPGSSYVIQEGTYYIIHNSNGNCLRMRDANNGYAVMEENGCNLGDNNEHFHLVYITGNTVAFYDIGTGYYLGESCPARNGNKIWGESGDSGTCVRWIL